MAVTREQQEQLTQVGPGTLMGNLFRRYWLPALYAWDGLFRPLDTDPVTV